MTHLSPFERPYQARYAEVRGEYLRSLLGTWSEARNLKTTLDIGCGHGYFSEILKERNLDVLGVDGRADNVAECRVRHPGIRFEIGNIESPEITSMGKFDFVLCFGLLYHLENPCQAIRHLFALTGQAILIEAILAPGGENTAVLFDECEGEDQGLNHIAVVPSESFLVRMLHAAGFPAVYRAKHPPVHPEFKGSVWMRARRHVYLAGQLEPPHNQFEQVAVSYVRDLWSTAAGRAKTWLCQLPGAVAKRLLRHRRADSSDQ